MATTYTIEIQNHSIDEKTYQVFPKSDETAENEVYAEPVAALDNIAAGGFDVFTHAAEDAGPARFYVNDLAHEAGDAVDHDTVATAPIEIDFTDREETKATVIQEPNGAYNVTYS